MLIINKVVYKPDENIAKISKESDFKKKKIIRKKSIKLIISEGKNDNLAVVSYKRLAGLKLKSPDLNNHLTTYKLEKKFKDYNLTYKYSQSK
jgi:hypothetical protein